MMLADLIARLEAGRARPLHRRPQGEGRVMTADVIPFARPDAIQRAAITAAAGHLERAAECAAHQLRLAEACTDIAVTDEIARTAARLAWLLSEHRERLMGMVKPCLSG